MTNLFGRYYRVSTKSGIKINGSDLEVRFEVPFDDDTKPNQSKIQIYNLTQTTISKFKRNDVITVEAGYLGDFGVIFEGKISRVGTSKENVDKITTIYAIEGIDYSKIKVSPKNADPAAVYTKGNKKGQPKKQVMKITFKAGTKSSTIIKRLCSVLGIKLGTFSLPREKTYPKGYTVTGNILNNLEDVVKATGAAMYWRRGKLIIRSIKAGDDERFILSSDTGLISNPEPFEEDGIKGFKVKCLLQHKITVASIITIKSATANGKFRVKKGFHIADGTDFLTECEVV